MTHARWHNSWEAALVGALHNLTDAEIRDATGRNRDYLQKLSVPGNGRELWFSHATALDRALVARGLPPQFLPLMQDQVGERPAPAVNLDSALRRSAVELGELSKVIDVAMADGRLDPPECRAIAKEAHELRDAIDTVLALVEPGVGGGTPALRSVAKPPGRT